MDFSQKRVLITGGSRGIGRACALAFAERGARVAVNFRQGRETAQQTLEQLSGGPHALIQADVADPDAVKAMVDQAVEELDGLDIVVNNAGISLLHPLEDLEYDQWQEAWNRTLNINLLGPANVMYCAARFMKQNGGGRIVNVSSRGAFRGEPEQPAYGASKAGLNALSQSLAARLAPDKIFVGVIARGGALQGYLADKAMVEKLDITSLEDFKRKEVKKAFDDNGDGKADLVACPPGWGCEKAITKHMKAYGLTEHINLIKAGYSASMADAMARNDAGKPVFFYTWTPNWTVYKLKPGKDVMWLNVPQDLDGKDTDAQGVEGAVTDPVKMGFVPNDINVVANKEFLKANPAADKLFEVMSVPIQAIFAQNNKMFNGENKQRDIERHVEEFIAENQDQWDAWLEAARSAE